MEKLRNERVGRLVRKLGGPAELERRIRAPKNSIKMWRIDGKVPYRWRDRVRQWATLEGIRLTPQEVSLLDD